MSMWVHINEQRGGFVGTGRFRALASQPSHSLQCSCSEPSLYCMPQGVVSQGSPVAGGWVVSMPNNCRRDSLLLAEMNTAWKGLWAPRRQSRPWQWVQGDMWNAENGQSSHCHSPSPSHPLTVKFNPIFKLIGVFCCSASSGAFSDPACSNRPESLFHFQTEAIPEQSSLFALAEQLVTPAVSFLNIIIILISNDCCANGDDYHHHFPPIS